MAAILLAGCKAKPTESSNVSAGPQPITNPSASASSTAQPVATKAPPQWGWQQYDEESFETQPSQGRVFSIPRNASRFRVKLAATLPVDAGAMTQDTFRSRRGVVREDRLQPLPCASIDSQQADAQCALKPSDSMVYVVRDRRALQGSAAARALMPRKPSEATPDKVHITLSVWACVAHCGVS